MYKLLSELPNLPENIDSETFNTIPPETYEFTEMSPPENSFLFGLIRSFKPKNILEIGVSSGGSTGLILSAIRDMKETTLTSIDNAEKAYRYPDKPVGFVALKENVNNSQWELVTGKDPSQVIESFGKKFDFAVIDTMHIHPIESLNFLSALPFLEDGAIVVLHDLSLYLHRSNFIKLSRFPFVALATRYLFSSVVGERIMVSSSDKEYMRTWTLPNIGAFQVNADTRKYIDGVFYSLALPWGFTPEDNIVDSIRNIVKKYYDKDKLSLFDDGLKANYYLRVKKLESTIDLPNVLQQYEGKYILFGAKNAENYIKIIKSIGFDLPLEIWDNNVYGDKICGVPIVKPNEDLEYKIAIIFTVKKRFTYSCIIGNFPNSLKSQTYFFEEL